MSFNNFIFYSRCRCLAIQDFLDFELEQSILRLRCTEMEAIADGT